MARFMARFICGLARFMAQFILNREIANIVELHHYVELDNVVHMAMKVERQLKKGVRSSSKYEAARSCHIASQCPNKRSMIMLDNGEIETEEEDEGNESTPSVEDTSDVELIVDGQALVVLRALHMQAKEDDDGLYVNVASKLMVDKLSLPTLKHPKPYKLQWLNDSGEMKQFDRRTTHDGYKNRYSFNKDGRNITFAPLTPRQDFKDVFSEDTPPGLPTKRRIEHQIDLIPRASIPNRPAYRSSPEETKELQRQVEEPMTKGHVRESMSPCVVPVLLVPKKDETWRMCVDYRAVNKITVKYRHPIPRLDVMLDELHGSTIFSKIDLKSGYHQIRIKEGDEWKTTFKTKQGLYECKSLHDHIDNLKCVLEALRREKLFANLKKCSFYVDKLVFLGFVVSSRGVEVDGRRRFVPNFSTIAAPLTEIIKKNIGFKWGEAQEKAFNALKEKLSTAPLLLPDFSKIFEIECDASGIGIGAVGKLNSRHARWIEFIEMFPYVIRYKQGKENVVADALSCRYTLISTLGSKFLGFEHLKELYVNDADFADIFKAYEKDLIPLPVDEIASLKGQEKVDLVKRIHNKARQHMLRRNEQIATRANKGRKSITFQPGDWVWVHFRKERFLKRRQYKLNPCGDGPFQVLEKINDNAYKLDLPDEYQIRGRILLRKEGMIQLRISSKPMRHGYKSRCTSRTTRSMKRTCTWQLS
ncbi:uncharacterized protein LOC121978276 [Zingiber officinale]|uniref:uncharacterized protein LOC121978276 n=1 Tax=Zingiber officinale TaxID=94328 RepID=UPI001C4C5964|nr:uncharacterized protein LOC121978276 [Zingiber officinale]